MINSKHLCIENTKILFKINEHKPHNADINIKKLNKNDMNNF